MFLKYNNICEVTENGHIVARYKYDALNRLIREDNKALNKTVLFSYDNNGNITERCEYAYTVKTGDELSALDCKHYGYEYDGDKLISYNGEKCEYNAIGNPTVYRGKAVTWKNVKTVESINGRDILCDGYGRLICNDSGLFTYDSDGRLIKQSNDLEFIYDNSGLAGVKYNGETYFYRKDAQGNILAILDNNGGVVVKYIYDAWGNHAIVDADGNDVESGLGVLNPFRYRGYYYDGDTGLYCLGTRYYDPETGRFISQDGIDYADPESINGLNLYAYCGNNPVMAIDPTGTWSWKKFFAGLGMVLTAVAAVAISIATFGAATPLAITMVAGVTLAAGVLTGVNGIATIVEAGTDYNFIRDGLFQGNETAYNWYAGVTEAVATIGTLVLGVYNATGYAKATRYGRKFLGKGYSKVGKGRWVSADGLRQMRFDDSHHILDGIKTINHFNLDIHASNMLRGRSQIIKKLHVFYKMFKIWFR